MANGEIIFRATGVALKDTFTIDPGDEQATPPKAPAVVGKVRILDGEKAGQDVFWRGGLKEGKNQEITVNQLRAMGWQDNDITKLTGLGSTKVEVTGQMDEYKGKSRVQYTIWAFRGERATLRDDDKASFAKRFKMLAAQTPVVKVTDANSAPADLPVAKLSDEAAQFPPLPGSPV